MKDLHNYLHLSMFSDYFSNPRIPGTLKRSLYFPWLYHQGKRKNILLFSSRRSGSTLLSQIISGNPGIRYIDQPFDFYAWIGKDIKAQYLPSVYRSQFINLSETEELSVKKYTSLMLQGDLKQLGGLEHFQFPFVANRTLIKICCASALINWFNVNFDVEIFYLVRHPIPTALSMVRNQWNQGGKLGEAYIVNDFFVDRYLSTKQVKLAKKILSEGTHFQQCILTWCLENLIPLKYASPTLFKIRYEDLILNSANWVDIIAGKLELKNTKKMFKKTVKPSKSSYLSDNKTRKLISKNSKKKLLGKWKSQISREQIDDTKKVLDLFEISEYRADECLPK